MFDIRTTATYSTIPRFRHCRIFINILIEVEVTLANQGSTYLRFEEDNVVASACLRYIHYGW